MPGRQPFVPERHRGAHRRRGCPARCQCLFRDRHVLWPGGREHAPSREHAAGDRAGCRDRPSAKHVALAFLPQAASRLRRARLHHAERPLNYADPGGRRISLALDMVPATAPKSQQQGIMLVNPGGPGASGLPWAPIIADGLGRGVAKDYDIVGFDPRGVGSSVPALSCDPSFFSGARRLHPGQCRRRTGAHQPGETYAADCEQKFGWLLPYMTTEDIARDMDSIRAAFGVSKINYYAFSYGTVDRGGRRHPPPAGLGHAPMRSSPPSRDRRAAPDSTRLRAAFRSGWSALLLTPGHAVREGRIFSTPANLRAGRGPLWVPGVMSGGEVSGGDVVYVAGDAHLRRQRG